MGNFLPARTRRSQSFTIIGTDLMGPIMVVVGRSSVKQYICVFNCLSTRAVHFEVVPSLEVDSFLRAYGRFCSRQNVILTTMYSDNGVILSPRRMFCEKR